MEYLALLIPILALSIPIVALLTRAKRRGDIASPQQERRISMLEEKVRHLEESIESMNGDVHELEEKQHFLSRLLEERKS